MQNVSELLSNIYKDLSFICEQFETYIELVWDLMVQSRTDANVRNPTV